jgi:septum formation protein
VDETHAGDAATAVGDLAVRKAQAVAKHHPDDLVLGCDSLIELDGEPLGKPASHDEAVAWWDRMRGRSVTAWTGHALVLGDRLATRTTSAQVHIGSPTDEEVARYVATGEPLGAAGAFRLAQRAGAFIDGITGHPGTVNGVDLPALRAMVRELDLEVTDLWV